MEAQKLKKLLNTTRPVGDHGDYIAVGSPMCHDLISVNKDTMRITYALDTFNEGRKSVNGKGDLPEIWDRLKKLIALGELKAIIEKDDPITDECVEVFSYSEGKVVKKYAYVFGWPNCTTDGERMYDNTHFDTFEKAKKHGIESEEDWIELHERRIKELELKIAGRVRDRDSARVNLKSIKSQTT